MLTLLVVLPGSITAKSKGVSLFIYQNGAAPIIFITNRRN